MTLVGIYQPPAATLQAFNQVNASERNRQTTIQNAQTYANQVLAQANAASDRLVNEAKAYQETVVSKLQAQAQYFTSIKAEYEKNPRSTLTVLYANALRDMLAQVPRKYVLHQTADGARKELRLQIEPIQEEPPKAPASSADSYAPPSSQPSGE